LLVLPADAIARLADVQLIATLGWLTAGGLALFVAFLGRLVDRGCPECQHCQDKVTLAGIRDEQIRDYWNGAKSADTEADKARERLFGVQVTPVEDEAGVAREAGPPDGPDDPDYPDY
jgi:hypothetical protein